MIQKDDVDFSPELSSHSPKLQELSEPHKDIISKLLIKDKSVRLGANKYAFENEFCKHPWFNDLNWEDLKQEKVMPDFIPDVRSLWLHIY